MIDQSSNQQTPYDRRGLDRAEGDSSDRSNGAGPARSYTGRLIVGSVVLVGGALAIVAVLATHRNAAAAKVTVTLESNVAAGPAVRTAIAGLSTNTSKVQLIGEARPYATVTLYAKVSGYLRSVNVDMGDRVKAGEVLAVIESPETDRAFSAAQADYENKQVTADRVAKLLDKKFVSPEEADQARTEAAVARERLAGLQELRGYEELRAPFTGTVTARFADPGALMQNAASSQTSALPVVTVAQTDSLRVFVYLDQGDAVNVRDGTPAVITMAERPGVAVNASVTRMSGQLDPKTRKMVAEVDVSDRSGVIVPGSFVQVDLGLATTAKPQAPVEALVVRNGKSYVGVIDDSSRVHFHPVTIAQNDGRLLTFADGVHPGDRLALSLGSAIADGALVRVAKDSTAAGPPKATPQGGGSQK